MSIDTVTDPYIAGTKVGSTFTLVIGFPYEDLSEVKVLVKTSAGVSAGSPARWIQGFLGNQYSITAQTVTITDTDATKAIVYRDTALTQLTGFSPEDDFTPQLYEAALDKLTRIAQDQQEQIDRSVKLETKQDGFTPVIKGEVPAGAIITRGVDKTDADGEDERGHLTAGDYSLGSLASDKAKAEDAAESSQRSSISSASSASTSQDFAVGVGSGNTVSGRLGKSAKFFAADAYINALKSSESAAQSATKLTAIESITGRIADPSDVHHVLNIEQYVETASLFAYGDKLTRDFNTATGPNQLYWDTTSVKGFPKTSGTKDADEPKIEARAYIIDRYAKDFSLRVDLTTLGPEQFITQIKSIVAQNVSKTGAALERVFETTKDVTTNGVTTKKRAVYYQKATKQSDGSLTWYHSVYRCDGTEIEWTRIKGAWVLLKLWDFGTAKEGVTRSPSEFFQIYRADGEKGDTTLDNWIIELDASALSNNQALKYLEKDKSTYDGTPTPIITLEIDIDGAKEYLEKARAEAEKASHSSDEAEASVHGRRIEFDVGVLRDDDGFAQVLDGYDKTDDEGIELYDNTKVENKLLGFLDGHESLNFAKTKLSALIHISTDIPPKIYKYKFDLSKISLISHWFPTHVIPTDRIFFNVKIYKSSDLWLLDSSTPKAGTRYVAGDDIPAGSKIGDIKDTVTPEYSSKITKTTVKKLSSSELDMTDFPVVVFNPPKNGIYTFVFQELSAKWFLDKSAAFKALYEKYVAQAKNYSDGYSFPVEDETIYNDTYPKNLQVLISDELAHIDGNTDRVPSLILEDLIIDAKFQKHSDNSYITLTSSYGHSKRESRR